MTNGIQWDSMGFNGIQWRIFGKSRIQNGRIDTINQGNAAQHCQGLAGQRSRRFLRHGRRSPVLTTGPLSAWEILTMKGAQLTSWLWMMPCKKDTGTTFCWCSKNILSDICQFWQQARSKIIGLAAWKESEAHASRFSEESSKTHVLWQMWHLKLEIRK